MNIDQYYRKNYNTLCKKLRRYLFTTHLEPEDVVQDAFVKVILTADKYDPTKGKEGPWIDRIVFNTMWNLKRKKVPMQVDIAGYIDDIQVSTAREKDVKSRILNVVDDEHKAVLFAVYMLNYSKEEISKILKMDEWEIATIISKYQMEFE